MKKAFKHGEHTEEERKSDLPAAPLSNRKMGTGLGKHSDERSNPGVKQENLPFNEKSNVGDNSLQNRGIKFRSQLTYNSNAQTNEPGGGKSLTIPDQSLTIKELLLRQQRGYPIAEAPTVFYNGEDDELPDLRRLDLVDLHELKDWANDKIKAEEERLRIFNEEQTQIRTEQYYKEKFEKERAEQEQKEKDFQDKRKRAKEADL